MRRAVTAFVRAALSLGLTCALLGGTVAQASTDPTDAPTTPNLDFDLLAPNKAASAQNQDEIDRAVATRRTMLTVHQVAGLVTLGLLTGTVVVGQLNYNDRYGGADTAQYQLAHHILAISSLGAFALTGLLALFAPEPYHKPAFSGFDSTTLHKVSMIGATLCMAAELVLGLFTFNQQGFMDQRALANVHLVAGYGALGFMAVGTTVLLF